MTRRLSNEERLTRAFRRRVRNRIFKALDEHNGYDTLDTDHTRLFLNSERATEIATDAAMEVLTEKPPYPRRGDGQS